MKYALAILFSAFAALLLPAQAENNAAAGDAPAATIETGRGTLYRVHHQGRTAWLFGTIHVGRPEFDPLGSVVNEALAQADRLVLELDIRDSSPLERALERHARYPQRDGVERHLQAETLAQLQDVLGRFGIAFEHVRGYKPWLLANLLLSLELERNGYRRQHGAEYLLLARASGKPVQELETAEYQMSLFAGMEDALQEIYLRETLEELGNGQALHKARLLIDAWAAGDGQALEARAHAMLVESTHSAEFMRGVLLGRRNPEMANKVEALLREEGSSFIGVGMLHLTGTDGVPALLRRRGYEVVRVY